MWALRSALPFLMARLAVGRLACSLEPPLYYRLQCPSTTQEDLETEPNAPRSPPHTDRKSLSEINKETKANKKMPHSLENANRQPHAMTSLAGTHKGREWQNNQPWNLQYTSLLLSLSPWLLRSVRVLFSICFNNQDQWDVDNINWTRKENKSR